MVPAQNPGDTAAILEDGRSAAPPAGATRRTRGYWGDKSQRKKQLLILGSAYTRAL